MKSDSERVPEAIDGCHWVDHGSRPSWIWHLLVLNCLTKLANIFSWLAKRPCTTIVKAKRRPTNPKTTISKYLFWRKDLRWDYFDSKFLSNSIDFPHYCLSIFHSLYCWGTSPSSAIQGTDTRCLPVTDPDTPIFPSIPLEQIIDRNEIDLISPEIVSSVVSFQRRQPSEYC